MGNYFGVFGVTVLDFINCGSLVITVTDYNLVVLQLKKIYKNILYYIVWRVPPGLLKKISLEASIMERNSWQWEVEQEEACPAAIMCIFSDTRLATPENFPSS